MNKIAIAIGGALLPGVAAAHPDHGGSGTLGLAHYLTDPFHAGLALLAVLGVLAARRPLLRRLAANRRAE